LDFRDHLVAIDLFQIVPQAPQRHSYNIAVMQARSQLLRFTQLEPNVMQQLHILRPQPRRMRTQIDEDRRPVRTDHFKRKSMPRLRQFFPSEADLPRQFV